MSNPKDQKPSPSPRASAPSVPGASAEPTRAATGDVREALEEAVAREREARTEIDRLMAAWKIDIAKREEAREAADRAESESARLREALAAERWLVAWQRTMRTLHESLTDRARSRVIRGWWHKANRRARAAEKRVARARAALSSSPATHGNSATKEE